MTIRADRTSPPSADLAPILLGAVDEQGDGVLVVDPAGTILHANRAFLDIWGLGPEVVSTGSDESAIEAVTHQLMDPDGFRRRIREVYADPEAEAFDEIRLRDHRVLERRSVPLRDPTRTILGRAWFFRDVTVERRRQAHSAFLADASAMLAGTLEYAMLAHSLAQIAVPAVADWCAVDVVADDGSFHRLGAAHVDETGADLLRELDRRYPLIPSSGQLRGRVLAERRAISVVDADDETLGRIARDADHGRLLRRLGLHSAFWFPLEARDRILGVLSFGLRAPRRDEPDQLLALGQELASRAALALDNARTYRQLGDREAQQAVVASLGQAALSRLELPALIDLAVTRLAATLNVEFAKVLELLPGGEQLRLVGGVGWRDGLVGHALLGTEAGSQAGFAIATGKPVIAEELAAETRFQGATLLLEHGVRSGMSVIIGDRDRPWGVLGAHTARRRKFSTDDINFLQSVANVLADAIERRQTEEALHDRDDRLQLTLAASQTGIWEWDISSGRLKWSDEISILHGLESGSAPVDFEAYLALIHPADRDRFRDEVGRAVREGSSYDLEFRIVWPDGTTHWTNGVGRVFFDEDGQPTRMFGIGRDITDRKRAEEERDVLLDTEREANALRDAFIGVLSHELRTPITTIYGGVKVLNREAALSDETRRALLSDVEAEADHLQRLVEDLLVLSRAERGRIDLAEEPIQLLHLARRVAAAEQTRWPGIEFAIEPSPPLPVARGDETAVEQVIRNLLSNAAKYSAPGSRVTIVADAAEGDIILRVLDEGHGIAADEVDQLFQLFYRASATARVASGAGIGLFVCRRLVDTMGGRIWALPRDPRGSEFGFALRRYESD